MGNAVQWRVADAVCLDDEELTDDKEKLNGPN